MHIRTGREGGCNHMHIRSTRSHMAAAAGVVAAAAAWSARCLHRMCTSTASCYVCKWGLRIALVFLRVTISHCAH